MKQVGMAYRTIPRSLIIGPSKIAASGRLSCRHIRPKLENTLNQGIKTICGNYPFISRLARGGGEAFCRLQIWYDISCRIYNFLIEILVDCRQVFRHLNPVDCRLRALKSCRFVDQNILPKHCRLQILGQKQINSCYCDVSGHLYISD